MRWGGPFNPNTDAIYTMATLSGHHRPSLDLLTLFDTGTELTCIDDRIASTIGLDESRSIGPVSFEGLTHPLEGYRVLAPRFTAFGRELEDFEIACVRMHSKLGIDGLIGRDFIRKLRTLIDEIDGRILLTDERIPLP